MNTKAGIRIMKRHNTGSPPQIFPLPLSILRGTSWKNYRERWKEGRREIRKKGEGGMDRRREEEGIEGEEREE